MATEKQIAANRANAKKSTGPKTAAGKSRSSKNAIRHGLLARSVVLESESRDRFHNLLSLFCNEYKPEGPTQTALVQIMAVAHWRMLRAWNMEVAGIDYEFNQQSRPSESRDFSLMETPTRAHFAFRDLSDNSRSLDVMNRYEARLDRQFANAFERLCRLQGRKPDPASIFAQTNPILFGAAALDAAQAKDSKCA